MFNYDVRISHHESTESGFFLNRSERWAEQRAQKKYELQIHTQRNIMHETFILQHFMCINALIFQYLQRSGKKWDFDKSKKIRF